LAAGLERKEQDMFDSYALPGVVLLVFYLYLLARWQHVRRPAMYLIGVAVQVIFGLLVGIFLAVGLPGVAMIFGVIDFTLSLAAVVGACYGAELPSRLASTLNHISMQPGGTTTSSVSSSPPT
jgi:hypothetical protein